MFHQEVENNHHKNGTNTYTIIMKKKVITIDLAFGLLSCNDHLQLLCNSTYFYYMSVMEQVAWVVEPCVELYTYATMQKQLFYNSNVTNLQLFL